MKTQCIRSLITLHLQQVLWQDGEGVGLILEGQAVFLRVCLLGQIQHTQLHSPSFPLAINQTLSFDRVLTNCREASLFPEVIRGEHVKIELIQVAKDFKGGKILARYEAPAHKFLYPGPTAGEGERVITLDKARKYQYPPRLTCTCSTTLSWATVDSPVDSILRESTTSAVNSSEYRAPKETPKASALASDLDTSQRLQTLLHSYQEPGQSLSRSALDTSDAKETKTPQKVRFKPPVPRFTKPAKADPLYQSTTAKLGPHQWEDCPRRSPKRKRSHSAPSSPARQLKTIKYNSLNVRPVSTDLDQPLLLSDLATPTEEVIDTRPPFVVRQLDPSLIARRDFCGCSYNTFSHSGRISRLSAVKSPQATTPADETDSDLPVYLNNSLRMVNEDYIPSGRLSASLCSPLPHRPHEKQSHQSGGCNEGRSQLLSKYLVSQPGNVRAGVDSPGKLIEEKIDRLKTECCACKRRDDSLGEDDLSEDLDRLRASLQAERNAYLSNTGRLLPQENVTVKIGPRDYWSRRMSEFTGKKHRLLFDETLEKVYNRLYTVASQTP